MMTFHQMKLVAVCSTDDTDIEMVTLTSKSATIESLADTEETDLSNNDLLLENAKLLNGQLRQLSNRRRLKLTLSHVYLLRPFKMFYQMQKEQLLECCFCFVRTHQTNGKSLRECFSPHVLLKALTNKIILMLKLMLDRRVIVSVLCYAFTGGVMVMSVEVCLYVYNSIAIACEFPCVDSPSVTGH